MPHSHAYKAITPIRIIDLTRGRCGATAVSSIAVCGSE